MRFENTDIVDPVFIDDLHVEGGKIDEEPSLNLVDALLQNVFGFVDGDVGMVVPIHDREREEGAVAVGGEWELVHRSQIVHVEESRAVVLVESADEQIDVVGSARAEEVGQVLAGEMSRRLGREVVSVAMFVKLDILTDVLGKLRDREFFSTEGFPTIK